MTSYLLSSTPGHSLKNGVYSTRNVSALEGPDSFILELSAFDMGGKTFWQIGPPLDYPFLFKSSFWKNEYASKESFMAVHCRKKKDNYSTETWQGSWCQTFAFSVIITVPWNLSYYYTLEKASLRPSWPNFHFSKMSKHFALSLEISCNIKFI